MGRTAKQGISFYRMNSGHITNKKVRLLYNEFNSDGYYIWCCLLDYAYGKWGYYFDCTDEEEVELFASEFCKKKVSLVKEVIQGCLKRDLFDKSVFELFGVLTSDMMQDTFIKATAERRSAGTVFFIHKNYLLISLSADVPLNLRIDQPKNGIDRLNNSIDQPNNTQIRLDKSREEEIRSEKNPTGGAPAEPSPKNGRRKGDKGKPAEEPEPHWDLLVKVWFDFGIEKFGVEPSFAGKDPKTFKTIVSRLKKRASDAKVDWNETTGPQRLRYFLDSAYAESWLKENFLLSNLEKQFDKFIQNQTERAKQATKAEKSEVQYLYDRFLESGLKLDLVTADHYDQLVGRGVMDVNFYPDMIPKRIRNLTGTNKAHELRLLQAYQEHKETEETKEDVQILKQLAVVAAFGIMNSKNIKIIPNAGKP